MENHQNHIICFFLAPPWLELSEKYRFYYVILSQFLGTWFFIYIDTFFFWGLIDGFFSLQTHALPGGTPIRSLSHPGGLRWSGDVFYRSYNTRRHVQASNYSHTTLFYVPPLFNSALTAAPSAGGVWPPNQEFLKIRWLHTQRFGVGWAFPMVQRGRERHYRAQ